MVERADVVVIGAGIAGVSAAHHLSVGHGVGDVLLCDPRAPLTLTSDKSTECYRNWWPGPDDAMVGLMNRSIDLLEGWAAESDNAFNLSRRGYLYLTADESRLADIEERASLISGLGAGPVRAHRGHGDDPSYPDPAARPHGADLLIGRKVLRARFPYVSPAAVGGLHVRRAGWLSAQQLGAWLLDRAQECGTTYVPESVAAIETAHGHVTAVVLASGRRVSTERVVNAAGPLVGDVADMLEVSLPVHHEVHRKMSFRDHRGAIPRGAPMLIWDDPQELAWSAGERELLLEDPALAPLAGVLPAGAHCRPDGGDDSPVVLGLWEYRTDVRAPTFPIPDDPMYPEMVMRGLSTMVPAVGAYLERLPQPYVDGGYYTKTVENRPLVGPFGPGGVHVIGALSGFGVMAAPAAGELVAAHVVGSRVPDYSDRFLPDRYTDPGYLAGFGDLDSGQL